MDIPYQRKSFLNIMLSKLNAKLNKAKKYLISGSADNAPDMGTMWIIESGVGIKL